MCYTGPPSSRLGTSALYLVPRRTILTLSHRLSSPRPVHGVTKFARLASTPYGTEFKRRQARSLLSSAAALLSLRPYHRRGVLMASTKAESGLMAMVVLTAAVLAMATVTAAPKAWADDSEAQALKQVQRELRQLRADRARDRKLIEKLEQKLDQVQSQDSQVRTTNQRLQTTTEQLQSSNRQLQTKTDEELKQIQAQVAAGPSQSQIARWLGGYWGSTQFTLTGGAAADFIYDRKAGQNTFAVNFSPLMLYRLNDWLAFEGTFTAAFSPGVRAPRSARRSTPRRSSSMTIWSWCWAPSTSPSATARNPGTVLDKPLHHRTSALRSRVAGAAERYRDAVARRVSVGPARAGRRLHALGSQRTEL